MSVPLITVIIPTRPGDAEPLALAAARRLDHPADRLEIIVARGKQPSVQRNTALRAAKGDLIYFLDDDSLPPPDNLRRVLTHFADAKVVMVGGPNVCPADAPPLEQSFAAVMGTWLAFGPSRARYTPVGKARTSGEKELILCNLMGRREALLAAGGFDEALYPNEENALMDELQKRGGTLRYDPEFIVHRRPRRTLGAFCKMLMNYGRGRAEQFRLHTTHRRYLAIVVGRVTARTIRSQLIRDRGDGRRGSAEGEEGKEAVTHVAPLEQFGDDYTLVECRLETGRTHQIRIHMAESGHVVCGERVYASSRRDGKQDESRAPRVMLHAAELGFVHPVSGETLRFSSTLPADMLRVLAWLRKDYADSSGGSPMR